MTMDIGHIFGPATFSNEVFFVVYKMEWLEKEQRTRVHFKYAVPADFEAAMVLAANQRLELSGDA